MARVCFYCGAPAVLHDFAIPPWVPPLVGLAGQPLQHALADEPQVREPRGPDDQIRISDPQSSAIRGKQPTERLQDAVEAAITQQGTWRSRTIPHAYSADPARMS